MTSPSSTAAFEALAIVVRDRGLDIADDPGRLRGMLNDVLAADARVNRAAVDALVLAAETGVPRELTSTPVPDEARLTAHLTGRGVSPELAGQTVRAWITAAQGGRTAPAPAAATEPPPVDVTAAPLVGATVIPPPVATFESTAPSASVEESPTPTGALPVLEPVLVPPPPPIPPTDGKGDGGLPRKTLAVLVATVVGAVALIGGVLALGGGDDDSSASTTTRPSTSTTATSTTQLGEPLLEILTPAAGTEASTSATELSGRVEPGSSVTVDGAIVTVDAAGNWKQGVTLPGPETKFAVVVTTPTGGTKTVEWVVKRDGVAPALDIIDPPDGTVLNSRTLALRGTTEPGAAVLVDGVGASPDAATSTDSVLGWFAAITITGDQQTFTVASTDAAGNVQTKTVTLRYQASAPPTTPRVPRPPVTPAPTTPPPAAPTIVAVNDDAGSWNFAPGSYFSFNVVGNDSGEWTDLEFGGLSGGYGTLTRLSGSFFQYTMRDNGNWTETFQYRLKNSSTGAVSNWATVTFHILCAC